MLASRPGWLRKAIYRPTALAALLLGLLLIQPTLCVIHCAFDGHHHHGAHSKSEYNHLLCSLSDEQTAQSAHIPVPAFWPSLPSALLICLLMVAITQAPAPLPATRLASLRWSPPIPPPRRIADSR